MTKKELVEALECVPNDTKIEICIQQRNGESIFGAYDVIYDKMNNRAVLYNSHRSK